MGKMTILFDKITRQSHDVNVLVKIIIQLDKLTW